VTKASPSERAQIFDVVGVAQSFREIAVDVVRGETTEFLSRWYQSAKGDADLSIWWDGEKRVVKQQLCLYGQVVEWNPIYGTRTGLVIEQELGSSSEESSEIVHYDERMQKTAIEQAIALLNQIGALSEADRSLLVYNFRESPKLHKNARERALKVWAQHGEDLLSAKRPGFWKRLSRWVFGK
jgi:hypothetical protein